MSHGIRYMLIGDYVDGLRVLSQYTEFKARFDADWAFEGRAELFKRELGAPASKLEPVFFSGRGNRPPFILKTFLASFWVNDEKQDTILPIAPSSHGLFRDIRFLPKADYSFWTNEWPKPLPQILPDQPRS